ncbi:unnamed protein product [Strongylus vulgaris]|uniref:Uncharacterized protein n=1 Tax=Strongylus vulgaris TaxID=40348 RepID=A0A3P7JLN7_STRVU|nr:unnamed protein product [Strongylus vulgaris]
MESITKRSYTNPFHSSTPVIPRYSHWRTPPRFLPAEVRGAIYIMEAPTAPGLDHVLADLLRAGGYRLYEILAKHVT